MRRRMRIRMMMRMMQIMIPGLWSVEAGLLSLHTLVLVIRSIAIIRNISITNNVSIISISIITSTQDIPVHIRGQAGGDDGEAHRQEGRVLVSFNTFSSKQK